MTGFAPRRTVLLASIGLAGLPGCSLFPTPPGPQIYQLSPQIVNDPPSGFVRGAALTVDLPTASRSLDTDRIALTEGTTRFDYYADSVWTDRLPALLQSLVVEAFEADGRVANVSRNGFGVLRGYLLRTEIREFEAQYPARREGPPTVAVVLALQLSAGPSDRLIGRRLVSARAPASRNKLDAVVRAFDAATGEALAEAVAWTVRAMIGDQHHRSHL